MLVASWMSWEAPLVMVSMTTSSAARPPMETAILAISSSLVRRLVLSSSGMRRGWKIKLAEDVDLKKIALATAGTVGADLANLVNEAALRAVRHGRRAVNQHLHKVGAADGEEGHPCLTGHGLCQQGFAGAWRAHQQRTLGQLGADFGFDPGKGVIVLGATNRPEVLDKALLRPGRFDRRITIDRPNPAGPPAAPLWAAWRRSRYTCPDCGGSR